MPPVSMPGLRPCRAYVEAEDNVGVWAPPVAVVKACHFEDALASSRCAALAFAEPLPPQDDVAMVDVAEAAPCCSAVHAEAPAAAQGIQPEQHAWVRRAAASATAAVMEQLRAKEDAQAQYIASLEASLQRAGLELPRDAPHLPAAVV